MRAAGGFRLKAAISLGLLFATAVTFLACSRASGAIEHTVIILQENHTFDNYFGTFPGADGATSGLTSTGLVVPLSPMPDADQASLCNSWDCAIQAMDAGKMDGFDLISGGLAAYTQATEQEIPNYWRVGLLAPKGYHIRFGCILSTMKFSNIRLSISLLENV